MFYNFNHEFLTTGTITATTFLVSVILDAGHKKTFSEENQRKEENIFDVFYISFKCMVHLFEIN